MNKRLMDKQINDQNRVICDMLDHGAVVVIIHKTNTTPPRELHTVLNLDKTRQLISALTEVVSKADGYSAALALQGELNDV